MNEFVQISTEVIAILFEESLGIVHHDPSKVIDSEGLAEVTLWFHIKSIIFGMILVEFIQHGQIGALGEDALLVDEGHDTHRTHGNQVEGRLIVHEFNFPPIDVLSIVFGLLQFEDVLHEKLLQMFVRKINAKLFEGIVFEILKSKDIQNSDGSAVPAIRSFLRSTKNLC